MSSVFFHGSSAGDFDNDGDCDLFLLDNTTKATLLVNDGEGNFESHPELVNHSAIDHRDFFTTDFFDINHDGYLDLFIGGRYSLCIFGDGHSFNTDNYVFLPPFYKDGFESFNDYCFYDIDDDGQEEVLILRSSGKAWKGFAIQILRYSDGEFIEASTDFISDRDNGVEAGNAAVWMNIEVIEGKPCILIQKSLQSDKLFEISDGHLSYIGGNVYPSGKITIDKGYTIYSDNGGYVGDINFGCRDNPFLGKACISFNGFGFTEEYNDCIPNGTDMSKLVENGYCLEFAIKNSDPLLSLDFKFSSITNREMWTLQTYCYHYEGNEHNCSGEWELVRIPLSSFIDWTDKNRNYWEMIDIFELQQMSNSSFYLDEIRIRKIK